jgi:hypothetical protein
MRERWSTGEYDILFADHPPTRPTAPTVVDARLIARRLGRSTGAVRSQWDDARSLLLGNRTAASRELRSYVEEHWPARGPSPDAAAVTLRPARPQ